MAGPDLPEPRHLGYATLVALGVAGIVLVVAVLPAEYGIDPTGIGHLLGFTHLAEEPAPGVAEPAPENETTRYEFAARWRLVEREVGNWSGTLTTAEAQTIVRVPLNVTNLTKLRAELRWEDDLPATGPDTMEVSIRSPGGKRSDLVRSDSGAANATLVWRSAPFPESANGSVTIGTAEDASAVGEHEIVVRIYGTGGAEDPGNPWRLRLHAERFELETTSLEGAADRVTLTIPPRGSVEYKFAMDANATMTYRWNATGPLYYDLHADHFEDPDDFLSDKVGVRDGDAGAYVAPYHGRHGWYWRNDSNAPVTVTLETRGDYRILGAV